MNETKITYEQARREIQSMNLINGFLFNSVTEKEDDACYIVKIIISRVLGKQINNVKVTTEKTYNGIDTKYHEIRFDAQIIPSKNDDQIYATVYDLEIEDREADRKSLPKRQRYYSALYDNKLLQSGEDYATLPEYISITIASYDPFLQGDMYYEARSVLTTHPNCEYNDGITNIFLYANGQLNIPEGRGKKLQQLLQYMLTGQKPEVTDQEIEAIDELVTKIKAKKEVTTNYMKQWDRDRIIARDAALEARQKDALVLISFGSENNIPNSVIIQKLRNEFKYDDTTIKDLFEKAKLPMA